MGSLNMNGPYDLNKESIINNVSKASGGNYALGIVDANTDNFHVTYVGRSDSDVKDRLIQHLSETKDIVSKFELKNTSFKYSFATSPKEAFEKECLNYHDFVRSNKLSNKAHPENSEGLNWKCPICK